MSKVPGKRSILIGLLVIALVGTCLPSFALDETDINAQSSPSSVEEPSTEPAGGVGDENGSSNKDDDDSANKEGKDGTSIEGNDNNNPEDTDVEAGDEIIAEPEYGEKGDLEYKATSYQTRLETGYSIICDGMDKAWSNTRPEKFSESGKVKIKKLDSNSTEAKLVYYYGHISKYGIASQNAITLENALTYASGNAKAFSASQINKSNAMIKRAKAEGIREWDSFQAYECTVVDSKPVNPSGEDVELTFIAYTCDTTEVRIGVTYPTANVFNAIRSCGAVPVLLPYVNSVSQASEQLNDVSALVIPGGGAVNPKRYKQKNKYSRRIDNNRDTAEISYISAAISRDMPTLGICRGSQILNVINGGTLYQDIPKQISKKQKKRKRIKHRKWHNINIYRGTKLSGIVGKGNHRVNSYHHQSVRRLGSGMLITARSKDKVVEATEMKNKTFIVGVQFHPETAKMMSTSTGRNIFMKLIQIGYRNQK